jgi:hypothetical protein
MDPDMVRQQAEEEAASRILHSRGAPPPDMRIEPTLPMSAPLPRPRFPATVEQVAPPAPSAAPLWGMAINVATSCALATTVGLVGGIMFGVKLNLVAWQGVAIGASAGMLLGWRLSSLALIRRGEVGRLRAYGAAFKMALLILLTMTLAIGALPHFMSPAPAANQPVDVAVFWKSLAAGAALAICAGAIMLRRALR